jgi:NADP-reducing hydrogenase subunit HndC
VDEATTEPAERAAYRVHLCFGPNCSPRGSRSLLPILETAVRRAGIQDRVEILATPCRNRCDYGPSMNVYPGPVFYNNLTPEAVEEIVQEHLVRGRPVAHWLFRPKAVKLRDPGRRRW